MSGDAPAGRGASPGGRERRAGGERARRSSKRRALRRRSALKWTALAVLIAAVGIGVYLLVHVLTGGKDKDSAGTGAATTTSTVAAGSASSVLLALERDGDVTAYVLLSAGEERLVLGMPPETLVSGPDGLLPLAAVLGEGGLAAGGDALDDLLGVRPGAYVSADESVMDRALELAGEGDTVGSERDAAAAAAASLIKAAADPAFADKLKVLLFKGDAVALAEVVSTLSSAEYVRGVLPGELVDGIAFAYYEPDLAATASLLGRPLSVEGVTVEVQNGSGLVGIAEVVADMISPLGFRILPPRNAEQFPDVEATQLFAAPNVVSEAGRIRDLLDRGKVVQREDLPSGRIVIIVGKDLQPEDLESRVPAPSRVEG